MMCVERGVRLTVLTPAAMALVTESVAKEAAASCVALGASESVAPEALVFDVFEATETEVLAAKNLVPPTPLALATKAPEVSA